MSNLSRNMLISCWLVVVATAAPLAETVYNAAVFPCESRVVMDAQTGVELTFLTTGASTDTNLYFHDRTWLSDGALILFCSNRNPGGLMGYLAYLRMRDELPIAAAEEAETSGALNPTHHTVSI